MRTVTVLGATGSVGSAACAVLKEQGEHFRVGSVVAHRDAAGLARIARELKARFAVVADPSAAQALADALAGTGIRTGGGAAAVLDAVDEPADVVVAGIAGAAGLAPTYAALRRGRVIALANKECLVCAGDAFMARARLVGATILPLDSEHNALFQALGDARPGDVEKMVLTASGGPFRTWEAARIEAAGPEDALRHPTWSMGAKISIDSASLMNKGLELIEAHHLFGIAPDRLEAIVHPQSIVHGLIHFVDGSVAAGLAAPDMRIPTIHCLAWPRRLASAGNRRLDLAGIGALTFEPPDEARFPCLSLARQALAAGGAAPTVLNAANEVAVAAFLEGRIRFGAIARTVAATMDGWAGQGDAPAGIEEALQVDGEARAATRALLSAGQAAT